MIIAQVCLRLATIKGHSKMCSFITQHNATDVTSFEGACNWHADCRNVHQSCCPWIECSFLYHKPSSKAFQRIWQYIQPASQPQTTCSHTSPGPPHPTSSPPRSSENSHPNSCCNNRFACSCGSVVEHCVSSAKVNSQGTHILTKKCIAWMHCKSLWIKVSAKCKCKCITK